MLKIILNETGLVARDHRGTVVAKIPMLIRTTSIVHVEKYRKSFRIMLNGATFWNVTSCTWIGDEGNVPKVIHDDEEEEEKDTLQSLDSIVDGLDLALRVV